MKSWDLVRSCGACVWMQRRGWLAAELGALQCLAGRRRLRRGGQRGGRGPGEGGVAEVKEEGAPVGGLELLGSDAVE